MLTVLGMVCGTVAPRVRLICNTLLLGEHLDSGLGDEQANETQNCLAIIVY